MRRRRNSGYAGEPERWTAEQRRSFAALNPGDPLPFERWPHDPAHVLGLSTAAHLSLLARAMTERRHLDAEGAEGHHHRPDHSEAVELDGLQAGLLALPGADVENADYHQVPRLLDFFAERSVRTGGLGSTRITIDLGGGMIAKVAYTVGGHRQNFAEAAIWRDLDERRRRYVVPSEAITRGGVLIQPRARTCAMEVTLANWSRRRRELRRKQAIIQGLGLPAAAWERAASRYSGWSEWCDLIESLSQKLAGTPAPLPRASNYGLIYDPDRRPEDVRPADEPDYRLVTFEPHVHLPDFDLKGASRRLVGELGDKPALAL